MRSKLDAVRQFWEANPLFTGESKLETGELAFFEEHERFTLSEHSDTLDPIFTRDVEPQRKVLDVGCGNGFWVKQFSARGAQMYACDLTDAAVHLTKRRLSLYGLSANVRQGNAEELPYESASFDHVNCQGVIHHTPNTEKCIAEFVRVVKPGGTVCFSVYYKNLVLRSKVMFRLVTFVARPFVRMSGRGREKMFAVKEPSELVRYYDGADNPIGKCYTRAELLAMIPAELEVLEERRFGLPRRAFPVALPTWLHRQLCRRFGLMLAVRCRRVEAPSAPRMVGDASMRPAVHKS